MCDTMAQARHAWEPPILSDVNLGCRGYPVPDQPEDEQTTRAEQAQAALREGMAKAKLLVRKARWALRKGRPGDSG